MPHRLRQWWALVWLCLCVTGTVAAPPESEQALQEQVAVLAATLRCVVCQNQSLADSNAPLAVDLRNEIAVMLRAGKTESDITAFMVQRYGDFVLYSPPLRPATWLLWLGPLLLLLLGIVSLYRHATTRSTEEGDAIMGEEA